MPRDNLLNSACLELFEYIKREAVKQLITHLVPTYRDRLMRISYVPTFQALVLKYDQMTNGYPTNGNEDSSFTTQEGTPLRMVNGRQSFAGLREMDGDEEAYFNTDDDVEDDEGLPTSVAKQPVSNGISPSRPLVPYGDDDDADESMDLLASSPDPLKDRKTNATSSDEQISTDPLDADSTEPMDEDTTSPTGPLEDESPRGRNRTPRAVQGSPGAQQSPPEPIAMKRRREEEDDDELGKMMGGVKRRNSSASLSGRASQLRVDGGVNSPQLPDADREENGGSIHHSDGKSHNNAHGHGTSAPMLRRKGSLKTKNESSAGKFAIKPINLSVAKQTAEQQQDNAKDETGDGGAG